MFTKSQGTYTYFSSALNEDYVLPDCSPRYKALLILAHRKERQKAVSSCEGNWLISRWLQQTSLKGREQGGVEGGDVDWIEEVRTLYPGLRSAAPASPRSC